MARRLTDLYITGKTISLDDGSNDPIEVWLQKLNPIQNEQVSERANQERVKSLLLKDSTPKDPTVAVILEDIDQNFPDRASRIDFIASKELTQQLISAQSEVASKDKWSKESFLEGLQAIMVSEDFARKFEENPEDAEVKKVSAKIEEYNQEVADEYETRRNKVLRDYESWTEVDIQVKMLESMIDALADRGWLIEFRKSEIWLAVREVDDHKKRYFSNREEVDELDLRILSQLIREYTELTVAPDEGKD